MKKIVLIFLVFGISSTIMLKAQIIPNLICDQSTLTVNSFFYPNTTTNYTSTSVNMDCMYLCGPNTLVYDTSFLSTPRCRVALINNGAKLISSSPSCSYYDAIFVRNNATLTINANANGNGFRVFYEPSATINDLTGLATTYSCSSINFPTVDCNNVGLSSNSFWQNTLSIYPNPATNILKIDGELANTYMSIKTVIGQDIISQTNATHEIDLSTFSEGIYFLNIQKGEVRKVYKIIKQ